MKLYEVTDRGVVNGMQLESAQIGFRIRLGDAVARMNRRMDAPQAYILVSSAVALSRSGDRLMSGDIIFGRELKFEDERNNVKAETLVLLPYYCADGSVAFRANGDAEVLIECNDSKLNSTEKGASALVRVSKGGSVEVLVEKGKKVGFSATASDSARRRAVLTVNEKGVPAIEYFE